VQITPRVTVLATLHVVQGAEKRAGNVHDPMYVELLKKLVASERVDFIFEEASGLGPTIAEKLALETMPFGHYVDIDPGRSERPDFGIPANSSEPYMIGAPPTVTVVSAIDLVASGAAAPAASASAAAAAIKVKRLDMRSSIFAVD